jgi:MerR family transcriptional regulator/heat shock protein HspR
MNRERSEPRYVISVAAKILGIQTHTLRYYERIGVVEPSRSRGNIRLYSERDLEQPRRVNH